MGLHRKSVSKMRKQTNKIKLLSLHLKDTEELVEKL